MKKRDKFLIVCACFAGAGLILAGAGYMLGGRVWGVGFTADGIWVNSPNIEAKGGNGYGREYIEETKKLEEFDSIDINMDDGDIVLIPSDHYGISYCVDKVLTFSTNITDGKLQVTGKFPSHNGSVGFFWGLNPNGVSVTKPVKEPYVKIYFPADMQLAKTVIEADDGDISFSGIKSGELKIKADYGDVNIEGLEAGNVEILASDGDLTLSDASVSEILIENDYGEVSVEGLTSGDTAVVVEDGNITLSDASTGAIRIQNAYGDTRIRNLSAGEIGIDVEDGEIRGEGLDGELLSLENSYGYTKLSDLTLTGKAAFEIEDGDLDIDGMKAGDFTVQNSYGDTCFSDVSVSSGSITAEDGSCRLERVFADALEITSDYGDVEVYVPEDISGYGLSLSAEDRGIEVNGQELGDVYQTLGNLDKTISITCKDGSIKIENAK